MCDCYEHKCIVCGGEIAMHLGDWNTPRNEVAVFHEQCFQKAHTVFIDGKSDGDLHYATGCGNIVVVSLSETALNNKEDNHPNY